MLVDFLVLVVNYRRSDVVLLGLIPLAVLGQHSWCDDVFSWRDTLVSKRDERLAHRVLRPDKARGADDRPTSDNGPLRHLLAHHVPRACDILQGEDLV